MQFFLLSTVVVVLFTDQCAAFGWTTDDLAMFDLVEELQQNFYEFFGIEQDANLTDIKRAYRRFSLKWHPDRNSEKGATERFRQVAAVYEILKTENGRRKYNDVLENGLPDWRQPIYYYRHVRKMSWWETCLLLLLIVSVGQYLMLWGSYFERRLALSEALSSRMRKKERQLKRKHNMNVDGLIEAELDQRLCENRPTFKKLFPFLLIVAIYHLIKSSPEMTRFFYSQWLEWRTPVVIEASNQKENEIEKRRNRLPKIDFEYSIATDLKPVTTVDNEAKLRMEEEDEMSRILTSTLTNDWNFDELAQLVQLSVYKYPSGSINRWEKIARILNRRPEAITTMISKLKRIDPKQYQQLCDGQAPNEKLIVPSKSGATVTTEPTIADDGDTNDNHRNGVVQIWDQTQQRLFEQALQQFPKSIAERWEKISRCVPSKTKEECLSRYKELTDLVRQRKKQK